VPNFVWFLFVLENKINYLFILIIGLEFFHDVFSVQI